MCSNKVLSTQAGLSIALTLLAMLALAPYASASTITIDLSDLTFGPPTSPTGTLQLTVENNPHASSKYDPAADYPALAGQPYKWDPVGAQRITGASGTFNGMAITGIRANNRATPPSNEILPYSYSTIGSSITDPLASYDNLYYPDGSPYVCFRDGSFTEAYPFKGGMFDTFGVALQLDSGLFVDLWSFGDTAAGFFGPTWPGGLAYGYKTAVPAPSSLWLLAVGLILALLAWRRRSYSRSASA